MARILINTFGSLGDLHPYVALSRGLIARGHTAIIATSPAYREIVEQAGVGFHPVRPDLEDFGPFADVARRIYEGRAGMEYIVRGLVMPRLAYTYDDLLPAARQADLLLTHPLSFSAQLLARSLGLRWLSTVLSPMVFLSVYDPPVLPPAPWLKPLSGISPALYRAVFFALRRMTRGWSEPVRELARSRGLPMPEQDPLFEGQYSPYGTLAMFSPLLAAPQRDWPPHTQVTGFAMHDDEPVAAELRKRLDAFLEAGEPPIVFTLGSSAIHAAGDFYARSAEIAQRLRRRAVLLTGAVQDNRRLPAHDADVLALEYAPYGYLFPRAAAIVHQGGVGTLAQAMRSGRPMLVVPFAHDQPDNAARARRLGIAEVLSRSRYSVGNASKALERLLRGPAHEQASAGVRQLLRGEDGVRAACVAIERVLTA